MKRQKHKRWQSCLAVVAVGALAFGLALQGAPPDRTPDTNAGAKKVKVGPGIPDTLGGIPVLPPITVDYRNKGGLTSHGPGAIAEGMDNLGLSRPTTEKFRADPGDPCAINEQCYTCEVCVAYGCVNEQCFESQSYCQDGDNGGEPCSVDEDCPDPLEGACTLMTTDVDGCDDGAYCNGEESCSGGACVAGTAPCTSPDACDERLDECLAPVSQCSLPSDCDDGASCTDDDCVGSVCVYTNACGPGSRCVEPEVLDDPPICIPGRCCDTGKICTRDTYDDCAANWFPFGDSETVCTDEGAECPKYSSGIAVEKTITGKFGPLSNTDCDDYTRIGDDYKTWDHATLDPTEQYMSVTFLRFVRSIEPGAQDGARWSIEFRDEDGVFIENTFFPDGTNDQYDEESPIAIQTVNFDPPLVIPTKGWVTWTVQPNFSRDGRASLYGTDAVEEGNNMASTMYVERRDGLGNTTPIRDGLGFCSGGARDGLVCDHINGNTDCDPGTCADSPQIVAFEMIAETGVSAPTGACCDIDTGDCTQTLPWECEGGFQGIDTLCGICDDGITPCDQIPDDPDCDVECLPIAACATQACCDTDGSCVATTNATCSGTVCDNEPGTIGCTLDIECPEGGHCVTVTGTSQGFGTDCDPNCCTQPEGSYEGADNCILAESGRPIINVPAFGEPPVTVTITGSNADATYDDSNFVCRDGPLERQPCPPGADNEGDDAFCGRCTAGLDPSTQCAVDEDCDTSEGAGDGVCDAHDCTEICIATFLDEDGDTRDLGWWVSFSLVSADDCADVRFDLCCTDINGEPLRPQWANLWNDCPCATITQQEGVDPPIGVGKDTEGFARGGPFCQDDNLWETYRGVPNGIYYKAIYSAPGGTSAVPPGATFQMHLTVGACPKSVCCTGSACTIVNEIACDELGGYWDASGNLDCGNDPTCALPPGETDNPCCSGACCTGTEAGIICQDDVEGQPMDQDTCETILDGAYVGGAACDDDPSPCPACLVESDVNCQESAERTVFPTDLDIDAGIRRADDFIATDNFVSTVCLVGAWTDADIDCNPPTGFNRCDCACVDDDQLNCVPQTNDVFTVCIWDDLGTVPGASTLPDNAGLVGCSSTTFTRQNNYGPESGFNFDEYTVSLLLDTPIPTTPTEVYWVQVIGDTTSPPDNTCNFYWARDGRLDGGDPENPDPPESIGGNDKVMEDAAGGVWEARDIEVDDMAICLNYPIEPPPARALGACCICDPLGACLDDVEFQDCAGTWFVGQACTELTCPQDRPDNDDCADIITVTDGQHAFNNFCATLEGDPPTDPIMDGGEEPNVCDETDIGADIWFAYTASCSGRLLISMCDQANYDAVLGVYTNGTDTCECPTDDTLLTACNDDACGAFFAPSEVEFIATEGVCYTIRIGGWRDYRCDPLDPDYDPDACREDCKDGCQGQGFFDVLCEDLTCFPPDALAEDPSCPTEGCEFGGCGTKSRYASFSTDSAEIQAVRVTFISVPGFEFAEGRTMWVQEPVETTEASGSDGPPGVGEASMWAANLGCTPFYTNWSQYDVVDILDGALVGDGVYDIQAILDGDLTAVEECYSPALTVNLSRLGDAVGSRTSPQPASPPNCDCNFDDIGQIVEKFKNEPASPRKARADIINSNTTLPKPDKKIDFVDISCAVECFRGTPCAPAGPPLVDPCGP